jgi:triacylglycerol lipase
MSFASRARTAAAISLCALTACAAESGVGVPLDASRSDGGDVRDAAPGDARIDGAEPRDGAARDGAPPIDGAVTTDAAPAIDAGPPCRGAPYPIILHHGFFGFSGLGPINYYFRVAETLRARGETVVEAAVDPFNSSEIRAVDLAAIVDETLASTGACKVNLIAHSQGGLDARVLVGSLGYGDRIASIVTVATPHRGTRVADVVLRIAPGWSRPILDFFAFLVGRVLSEASDDASLLASLESLAEANAPGFDAANPDDPRVDFFSVAGRSNLDLGRDACAGSLWPNPSARDAIDPLLSATGGLLRGSVFDPQPNDGLVTVASARWGTFLTCIPADHFDEIGQIADVVPDPSSRWNHVDFYVNLVDFLRTEGH